MSDRRPIPCPYNEGEDCYRPDCSTRRCAEAEEAAMEERLEQLERERRKGGTGGTDR